MSEPSDDLLRRARERLREIEETDSDELGERLQLEPGEHFHGRFRGSATMTTKEGDPVEVVALWDEDGAPRFHYRNAALVSELAEASPEIGDAIAIVRGKDKQLSDARTKFRYSVRTEPCSDPLPGSNAAEGDDDIPF